MSKRKPREPKWQKNLQALDVPGPEAMSVPDWRTAVDAKRLKPAPVENPFLSRKGLPPPTDPEFRAVRAELARLFIEHKGDLDMAHIPDRVIADNVVDIAAACMACTNIALAKNDEAWMLRHRWWVEACLRLYRGYSAVHMDG